MKKLFAIMVIAVAIVACNNNSDKKADDAKDSAAKMMDTAAQKMDTAAAKMMDTTKTKM